MTRKEFLTKWIAALRSGAYKQGKGLLRSGDDCYCCLGVACDVYDNTKWVQRSSGERYAFLGATAVLPPVLCEFVSSYEEGKFVRLNDTDNRTFAEIADYIEQNLLNEQE